MPTENLLTKSETAKMLALSERQGQRLVSGSGLKAVKIGAAIRFDPVDVRAFIDAHKTRPK